MFALSSRAGARSPRGSRAFEDVIAEPVMQRIIRRECARADRRGGDLSLVVFRVHGGSRGQLRAACRLARTLLRRARETDAIGWLGDHYLAALLPDTPAAGAAAFAEGVCRLLEGRIPKPLSLIFTYPRQWIGGPAGVPSHGRITPAGVDRFIHIPGLDSPALGAGPTFAAPSNGNQGFVPRKAIPSANGNGHTNGNGHGHVNGNGKGHVLTQVPATRSEATTLPAAESAPVAIAQPGLSVEALEQLLTHPMPRWKRTCDLIGATLLILVLAPLMALVAIAIKLTSRGPVLFKQRRAGLGGKPFVIYKFRTMQADAEQRKRDLRPLSEQDGPAFKLADDPRVTRLGRFLRKTSIDELPQLWNVIKGQMSLVGPRPLPLDESDACEPWQRRRLDVTPGLTCIWQVDGRSRVTFAEWVRMDMRYMRRRTFWHDLVILLRTIPAVLLRKGAR